MKSKKYKLIIILLCCLGITVYGQNNCRNTFNSTDYSVIESYTSRSPIYVQCGTYTPPSPSITNGNSATIVTVTDESFLPNITGNAIKINPTSDLNFDRNTIRTSPFLITNDVLSFDFSQSGVTQLNHYNPYFQYRLLNSNTLEEIDSGCYQLYHENATNDQGSLLYNDCLYDSIPIDNTFSTVYTPDWVTQEINVSHLDSQQVILEFTVSDCNLISTDGHNHYNTVYINNICQRTELEDTYSISINQFDPLNCPTDIFTFSGTYEAPFCDDDEVMITVSIAPHVSGMNSIANAVPISTSTFTGFSYSFDIDPNNLGLDPNQNYEIFVTLDDPNGTNIYTDFLAIANLRGAEITFNGCSNVGTCHDLTINITSDIPNCEDLANGVDICGDFSVPASFTLQPILLKFINNDGSPENDFELSIDNPIISSTDGNGTGFGTFCFSINESSFPNLEGDYDVFATISAENNNSACKSDTNNFAFSFDTCDDGSVPVLELSNISIEVDYAHIGGYLYHKVWVSSNLEVDNWVWGIAYPNGAMRRSQINNPLYSSVLLSPTTSGLVTIYVRAYKDGETITKERTIYLFNGQSLGGGFGEN